MFKRKLFKRALPIILSVAMIFQSMPATALAAESPAQETAADSETLDESTDTVNSDVSDDSASDASSSDENSSEDSASEDNASEDSALEEKAPAEDNSEETSLEENASSESESEQGSSEEKGSEESSSKEDSSTENTSEKSSSEETTAPEETSTVVQTDSTEEMEGVDQKEDTAKPAAVLVDEDKLRSAVEKSELHYDEETKTVFALYDADTKNPFKDILNGYYYDDEIEGDVYFFYVELDDKGNLDLTKQLHYTWKDANNKDLSGVPNNAGTYALEIKLDAIDQVCKEAKTTLNFRIDPRGVMVDYSEIDQIIPGTTVEDAIKAIQEDYQLNLTNIYGDPRGDFLNKEAYVASCAVSIIRERLADGKQDGSTLNLKDVLKSNEEYSVKLDITLKDKDNYTLSNTSRKLEVISGVDTEIKANTIQTDGTNFGWTYGKSKKMAELIDKIAPFVVEKSTAGSDEEKKVTDSDGKNVKLQYQWFDADKKELEESASDGTEIPETVKDAGTYYLRISYTGEAGHYNASTIDITIVVSTADVYIGDIELESTDPYIEGTTVKNALQTIKSYKVYETGAAEKTDLMKGDKYFWGVSYNGDADENTQSYEPVFKIRRGQVVKDKDGNNSTAWEADYLKDTDRLIETEGAGDEAVQYKYRIEFSGKKAVYGENDAPVDINDSQKNYRVDVTEATRTANACELTVKAASGPVIDVSKILENEELNPNKEADKGSLKNPLTKVYDGDPLYEDKGAYKKATVKGDSYSSVSSTDLTYQWQKITGYTEIVNDDNSIDINVKDNYNITCDNVEYASAPYNAGNYRLAISYTDKKTGAVSKTEYVYYTIQKEDILIEPKSDVTAYYGETVSSYLTDITAALRNRTQSTESESEDGTLVDYTISDFTEGVDLDDGKEHKPVNEAWLLSELKRREKEGEKALTWVVERKITEGDKANSWYELQPQDTFVEGGEYRLTVYADWQAEPNSLQNYNNRYELDFKNEQIKEEQTGEYKIQARYADKQSVAITPAQTQGIEVKFEVDWDKITQTTKVYDGEPFDETMLAAVKSAVKAYNTKTGAPIDQADITFGWEWRRQEYISNVGEKEAIHAGNYYLTLSVEKGDKYLGQKVTYNADFTDIYKTFVIMPAELTVTPELKDEIKAGTRIYSAEDSYENASNVRNIIDRIAVEGNIAEADKPYIIDKVRYYSNSEISYPYPVGSDGLELKITDKATGQLMSGYLKGNHSYNVRFDFDGVLNDWPEWNDALQTYEYKFYGTDYTLKFATVSFEAVKAGSTVRDASGELWSYDVAIQDSVTKSEKNNFTHTITPREGIPYNYYENYNKEKKKLGGNYFAVHITAPLEYTDVSGAEDKVIYQSSIENAGGYICDDGVEFDGEGNPTHCKYIIAVFDAAKIAESEDGISFEITWEEGFTETFTITVPKTLLMEDLQKAVLPKSLAFNGASAKMTVGEGQQLDLKITKTQMADTICAAYESSDEKVLTVSDSGYVTAIHTGKATVTAYAAYQDAADGKIKPFIDAKGNYAKAAKLNITVSKVSEVKNIKLEAHDTYAYIDYADVPDGYRREIYVLEGANIPAADFDEKINAVQNGNYDAFTAHLFITATERNTTNPATGKKFWGRINGLKPNMQYTVYVRNVSALRSFLNGEQIDASEFATAGKPVKLVTTKSQQKALNGYFKTAEETLIPVNGKSTIKTDTKSAVKYYAKYDEYVVNIAAKSAKFDVEAKYYQKDQAEIDYADNGDYIWYPLALTKDQQKDYVNPKLTYYVTDDYPSNSAPSDWKTRGYVKAGNYYFIPTSTKAAIDKNGKISLKGDGVIHVLAYDAEQDIASDPVRLSIMAEVDGLAGKAIKMKVGTTVSLSNYLTYKQGSIKLSQYSSKDLSVTCEDEDGAFEIVPQVDTSNSRIDDYKITAKRPTTKPLELRVSDKNVKADDGSDIIIPIKLSAAALDPVKSLKAYDVYDTEGSIRFDYTGSISYDNDNLKFRIEVKDQTGRILKNELVGALYDWKDFYVKNEAYYRALYHHDYKETYGDGEYEYENSGFREYNAKKNIWTYYYDLKNLDNLSLKRLSSYTVSVTAVYDGYDAKTVSTKIKTTNIPASKTNAIVYDAQGKDTNNDGGKEITVYKNNKDEGNQLNTYPLLKSGNTYTLDFTGADSNARNMKTDTLTWKSSNTKVATVKANQGTYTATLKAVKKGTTQITVTSKITKKIVARWTIFVNAVGEANGYFGDDIFQGSDSDVALADKLGADLLTLNNSMTFTLANGEKKWVAFKAPSYGYYFVTADNGSFIPYDSDSRPLGYFDSNWSGEKEKGETVYFLVTANDNKLRKASVTITATGRQYTSLFIGTDGTKVQGGTTVTFTAPEENVYTFTAFDKDGKDVSSAVLNDNIKWIPKDDKRTFSVNGSDEYIIKVTPAELLKDGTKIDLKKGETKYYQFTADESNEYTIYTTGATEKIASGAVCGINYNNSLYEEEYATPKESSETDTDPKNVGFSTRELEKKSIIYIALTAGDKDTTATFKVEKAPKIGESFTIAKADDTRTVVYTVDEDGEYQFTVNNTKAQIDSIEVNNNGEVGVYASSCQKTLTKGDYVRFTVSASEDNASVTVTCTLVEPIIVKAGEAGKPVKVSGKLSQKVEFTALENGWYAFNFDNDKVKVSGEITSSRSAIAVASGDEFYAKAGEVRTFTVKTTESTEQTANITITKVTVEKLADTTKTLTKGKTYRYYWTAENEGLYDFAFTVTGAEIAYSKTEGVEDESLDTVDGYYSKGDTFYLTIKTDSSADGSFKAVIAKQDAEELISGQEKGITVGANASKWVSFTSKWSEKVRYQYSKADADGFDFYESTGLGDGDYLEYYPFDSGSRVLRPGQKVYYKVVNSNSTEKTVKLKIAPLLPKEINVEAGTGAVRGTDTIKAGTNGWYHFHAANAGRYNISVISKIGDTTTEVSDYDILIYRDLTAGDNDNDYSYNEAPSIMEAGKDLYIRVTNDAADAEITVTVTDMAAAAVPLELDVSKPLNLKKGVTQYLLFNAKEIARYTLKAVDKDNKAYELPVTYYINRDDPRGIYYTPISAIALEAGSTILFEITTSADVDVTVTLTKENVIELTNEAAEQTIKAGETLYFRAKIGARDSRYFIETSEVAEGLTLEYKSVTGEIVWNNGYADFVPKSKQEEVVFGLTATSTFEGTKTFKIKKGIVTPTAVKAGTPVESSELTANHKVWYSFTPEKAGRYSIKANGASVRRYNNVTGSGTSISTPSEFLVTDEMVGKEVIYAVYHTDTTAKKVSLSIAEVTAAEFTSGKYTVDITKIEPGEKIWLHFKAASDGRYTFHSSDLNAVGSMQWYEAIDANDRDSVDFDSECCLNAEEEYYIAIPYNTKPEKNFDIQVSAITDSTAEAVSVSETAKEFEMKAGEVKWLKFTPTKTANYQFKLENVTQEWYSKYIEQYDSIAASACTLIFNNSTYAFAANKTVYFKLTAADSLPEGSKPSIQITAEDMQALTEGSNTITASSTETETKYAFFAPSESAVYSFELTDYTGCEVQISVNGSSYDNGTLYLGNSRKYALDKEHPAYIKVEAYDTSASAEIRIQKLFSIGEMRVGDAKDVTLTSDSNMTFYQFTAEEDGVYIFDTNNDNVLVYASDNIGNDLLNPDNIYGSTGSVAVELTKGTVKYIRVAEYKYNLSSSDTFTLTCKKAKETSFTGEDVINLNLKKGEPVLVRWTAGARGNYQFGFNVTDGDAIKYNFCHSNINGSYSSPNSNVYVSTYESSSLGKWNLILEASGRTQVEVFAQIVPRSISVGSTETVELDSSNRFVEEFDFWLNGYATYIIHTTGANSALNSYIIDSDIQYDVTTYYLGSDCYWIYNMSSEYWKWCKFCVETLDYSSDSFDVSVYYYNKYDGFELNSAGLEISDCNVQPNEENWYQFKVKETDWYGFGADDDYDDNYVHMNLYRRNGSNLELLGTKEPYDDNKIWSTLQKDDIVLLQINGDRDSYSINVTCDLQQIPSDWAISGNSDSHYVELYSGQESVISLDLSELSNNTKYAFALTSYDSSENVRMALYQVDGDSVSIVEQGRNFSCEINPNCSYELRVSNYSSSYWNGTVAAQKEYPYEAFELSLDNNAQEVTVIDGSEARFSFTVPEDGNYLFYGTADSNCDNYAELWVNGVYVTDDDQSGGNNQFSMDKILYADDIVELRTYRYNHNSEEITYTVHIEKVPEGYNNLTKMNIGGTSPTYVYSLAAGDTKIYRFIAPASNDDSTKVSYIFYSDMYYSSEDIKLTASVSLASEVSAYALDTVQKDNNGNFYKVVKLTPGKPYILSVTNNGNSDVNGTIYVYAHQYIETEGGDIGGSIESASVSSHIAAGEEWISYTAAEDGIYTFTVSDANDYGFMYLYRVKDSQLTQDAEYRFWQNQTGKISNVILNKDDQVLVRIYRDGHEELTCKVQASWEVWNITSVENDSNTIEITTNTSNEEGKIWLTFEDVTKGSYTISTTDPNVTLKLYKNRTEVINAPDSDTEEQQRNTVTFEYQPGENAVYQLGIATNLSSINLTITKEPESETPEEGDSSGSESL